MFVGEHALEHENLLSLGMIVRRKPRAWPVAHDRGNLARLRRTHQVDPLTPDRPARTRRPLHPSRVGHGPDGEIPVDCLTHGRVAINGNLSVRAVADTTRMEWA